MSCYICNKDTLETVLKAQMMCESCKPRSDDDISKLWLDIVQANYEAVRDRYGDKMPEDLKGLYPVPFTLTEWFFNHDRPNKLERYDALKEYIYQCSEGDYHKRPGYYKSNWCLDSMLTDYINKEFGNN